MDFKRNERDVMLKGSTKKELKKNRQRSDFKRIDQEGLPKCSTKKKY